MYQHHDSVAEAGISGLDGIYQALTKGNTRTALKVTRGLLQRRARYLGGVKADELKGLVPTPRTLYCRRRIESSSSIAKNSTHDFFRKGIGDDADNLGYASGPITLEHTNIGKDGTIPQGEVFVANGIAFEFPHDVVLTNLVNARPGVVEWIENSGNTVLPLATVKEMPQEYSLALEYDGAASATDRNIRPTGRMFRFKRPLFIIRGLNSRSDEGYLRVTMPAAWTSDSSADMYWTARLYGTWFQDIGRRAATRA